MARRTEQRGEKREQILAAAAKVFAEKGFKGATNKDIAAEAGVTPGLIYWYFANKYDLFAAVLAHRHPVLADSFALSERGTPREILHEVARQFLSPFQDEQDVLILRVVISEAIRLPEAAEFLIKAFPGRVIYDLLGYLRREAARGRLRDVDPVVATQAFFGIVIAYAMGRFVLNQPHLAGMRPERYLEEAIDIYVTGVWRPLPENPDDESFGDAAQVEF